MYRRGQNIVEHRSMWQNVSQRHLTSGVETGIRDSRLCQDWSLHPAATIGAAGVRLAAIFKASMVAAESCIIAILAS